MSVHRPIQALGEIALRVDDLDAMQAFYAEIIGLPLLRRFPSSAFFKIADGYAGHTQVLALFDRSGTAGYRGLNFVQSTVDHLAFTIALQDYEPEKQRLEQAGQKVHAAVHPWTQWRSLYVTDPEGNTVELVCYDADVPLAAD